LFTAELLLEKLKFEKNNREIKSRLMRCLMDINLADASSMQLLSSSQMRRRDSRKEEDHYRRRRLWLLTQLEELYDETALSIKHMNELVAEFNSPDDSFLLNHWCALFIYFAISNELISLFLFLF
jgi:hypothetical protein